MIKDRIDRSICFVRCSRQLERQNWIAWNSIDEIKLRASDDAIWRSILLTKLNCNNVRDVVTGVKGSIQSTRLSGNERKVILKLQLDVTRSKREIHSEGGGGGGREKRKELEKSSFILLQERLTDRPKHFHQTYLSTSFNISGRDQMWTPSSPLVEVVLIKIDRNFETLWTRASLNPVASMFTVKCSGQVLIAPGHFRWNDRSPLLN